MAERGSRGRRDWTAERGEPWTPRLDGGGGVSTSGGGGGVSAGGGPEEEGMVVWRLRKRSMGMRMRLRLAKVMRDLRPRCSRITKITF